MSRISALLRNFLPNIVKNRPPQETEIAIEPNGVDFTDDLKLENQKGLWAKDLAGFNALSVGEDERLARTLKISVFVAAMLFVSVLLCLFCRFVLAISHSIAEAGHHNLDLPFDWHIVFLTALMVIPATATILVLARSIFTSTPQPNDESVLPTVTLLKELLEVTKSITK